jgi:signal transduction histidine kinase
MSQRPERGPTRHPHIVVRFAVASLAAFVLVGAVGMGLMVRYARERAERAGAFHAAFVASAVLGPALSGLDLSRPITGDDAARVRELVRERILADGRDVRVKVWRFDGTIVFSDAANLVGKRFPEEAAELAEVVAGHPEMGISDLDAAENVAERGLADKLLFAYVPLRIEPGGPIVAVAEIYQDYAVIQEDIDAFVARMLPLLGVGLLVLYAAILPIAMRISAELRRRNERLAELLEREQQTVAELRDLAKKKDDFVSAASHELRTPLTSIRGSLATLKWSGVGADEAMRTELLEAAERQTKRLERLVVNILAAARLDGDRPIEFEPVDLAETARAVAAELDASDRVVVAVPEGSVETDRARIVDVMTYLLENALKYSPDGSSVTISADSERSGFRLWVTDHGVGIDPADQAAIFERFHQIDQSATRSHGGLGLGLHLAKELVEELQGRVDVASAPGRGSTFTVLLPSRRRTAAPPRSPLSTPSS